MMAMGGAVRGGIYGTAGSLDPDPTTRRSRTTEGTCDTRPTSARSTRVCSITGSVRARQRFSEETSARERRRSCSGSGSGIRDPGFGIRDSGFGVRGSRRSDSNQRRSLQRRLQRRITKDEAVSPRHLGDHALAAEDQCVRHLTEHEAQGERRRPQPRRTAKHATDCSGNSSFVTGVGAVTLSGAGDGCVSIAHFTIATQSST